MLPIDLIIAKQELKEKRTGLSVSSPVTTAAKNSDNVSFVHFLMFCEIGFYPPQTMRLGLFLLCVLSESVC